MTGMVVEERNLSTALVDIDPNLTIFFVFRGRKQKATH
jgi:hypothetical protein